MTIGHYIKDIGRGKDGARALSREQAQDLMGLVLDGNVSDIELGAFCIAMRIKGETAPEAAGFLDAIHPRMARWPASDVPVVVIPSYNGARKLPLLTPLLALLLAREGLPVLVHGTPTEDKRVFIAEVLAALDIRAHSSPAKIANSQVVFVPTGALLPGLQQLLDVRRVLNLRNPAHSLVKLMNPVDGPALILSSYTHPEYAISMAETFALMQANAMLIRGTEGESVADPRRTPKMQALVAGQARDLGAYQAGPLTELPVLPSAIDAHTTASYIRAVLSGIQPVPAPIAQQVAHTVQLHRTL